MPKTCEICGKGRLVGNNVSHAHNKSKKVWQPNLQKVRALMPGGRMQRIWVCTRCLRSGYVKKAVQHKVPTATA